MAADIPAIRRALAQAVADWGEPYDYTPDALNVPAVVVGPPVSVDYNVTLGGAKALTRITLRLHVLVSRVDDANGQKALDQAASPAGIKAAIEVDRTLGGKCLQIKAVSASDFDSYLVGSTPYFGFVLTVEITA